MLRSLQRSALALAAGLLNAWVWTIFLLPTAAARFSAEHLTDSALLCAYFLVSAWVLVLVPFSLLVPIHSPVYRLPWAILLGAILAVPAFALCGALFGLFNPLTEWHSALWAAPVVLSTGAVIGGVLSWLASRALRDYVLVEVEVDDEIDEKVDQSPAA